MRAIALKGSPQEELVRKTSELSADALVTGSQGTGSRMFLGSVSAFCVKNCQFPVFVIKER